MVAMAAKNVQISLPSDLLSEVDARPEAKRDGRSAVIQRALSAYLAHKKRQEIDDAYARGYGGRADQVFDEMSVLIPRQRWPKT